MVGVEGLTLPRKYTIIQIQQEQSLNSYFTRTKYIFLQTDLKKQLKMLIVFKTKIN